MTRLDAHFTTSPFLLGPHPSLGDIALMGPLFGHFYRDLHSSHLMRREAPFVCMWVERMCYGNAAPAGTDWRLDASALAVFGEIGAGFASFTRDTQAALDRSMTSLADGTQLPRHHCGERRHDDSRLAGAPARHQQLLGVQAAARARRVSSGAGYGPRPRRSLSRRHRLRRPV